MRKRIMPGLLILILVLSLCACQGGGQKTNAVSNEVQDNRFPVTIKDDAGRQVTVEKRPQRIVSLAPSHTEILFSLDLGDRIAGVTSYCDYPTEAQSKPRIGGYSDPSMEKIIAAQPDLVLADNIHQQLVENLQAQNIKVLVFNPRTVQGVLATITRVGEASGENQRAARLVADLNQRVERVKARVADVPAEKRPLVYYEVWYEPLMTAGPNSLIGDVITLAGGKNMLDSGSEEYPMISQELILQKNPDIMVHSYGKGMDNTPGLEQILNRPGWQNVACIKNRRVVAVDTNLITRAGPRIVDALELLARGFYPERFK